MQKILLILSVMSLNGTINASEPQKNSPQTSQSIPRKQNMSNEEIERQIRAIIYQYGEIPQKKIMAAQVSGTIPQPNQPNNPTTEKKEESSSVEDIKRTKNMPEVSERVKTTIDELAKKYLQRPKL